MPPSFWEPPLRGDGLGESVLGLMGACRLGGQCRIRLPHCHARGGRSRRALARMVRYPWLDAPISSARGPGAGHRRPALKRAGYSLRRGSSPLEIRSIWCPRCWQLERPEAAYCEVAVVVEHSPGSLGGWIDSTRAQLVAGVPGAENELVVRAEVLRDGPDPFSI